MSANSSRGGNWPRIRKLCFLTYGTVCHICNEQIDMSLSATNPRSPLAPSVDHLVPKANGGTDTLSNLRPAHVRCNSMRVNQLNTPPTDTSRNWYPNRIPATDDSEDW
ncbi:hypothetical protein GCM10010404_85540 [Nonomuraea africana]|uniref:HNH endonuclease n=1 Tax=Nonomuraea africana TaxID=46171 RepID=UPI00336E8FBF